MKRAFSFVFALAFVATAIASCTSNFEQFKANTGGGGTSGTSAGGSGGTACGGACCTSVDCPAPSDPCKRSTCIASVCGEEPRTDGTEVAMQTAGDCQKAVCQGGAVVNVGDNGDTLDDKNDCTDDVCDGGKPSSNPTMAGAACTSAGGKVCDGAGHCVQCLMDADCMPQVCDMTHTCVSADCKDMKKDGGETDVDCGGPDCSGCGTGDHCEKDTDCQSGVCPADHKCAAPKCDDGVKNGDETDKDCGGSCPNKCGPTLGCNGNGDCVGNQCTGAGGTCVPNCNDKVKNNAETDIDCGGGTCDKCDLGQDCAGADSNCKSDNCAGNNKCAGMKSPDGSPCAGDATCVSGHCQQGVCCATGCTGTCKSCDVAGMLGTCINVPAGQDPLNQCNNGQVCDGNGGCAKPNSAPCGGPGECLSNQCVDGVCCESACGALCKACNIPNNVGKCINVPAGQDPANECAGALSCDGNGACQKANGAACGGAGECSSGFCADGVCCDMACGGTCMACTQAKKGSGADGACGNIMTGTDPDNECNDAAKPNCNGNGMCGP